MPKLKTIREVESEIEATISDRWGVTEDKSKAVQEILTQDRQAIREALREGVINLRPNSECIDYVLRDNILDLVDDLLGGEVTE